MLPEPAGSLSGEQGRLPSAGPGADLGTGIAVVAEFLTASTNHIFLIQNAFLGVITKRVVGVLSVVCIGCIVWWETAIEVYEPRCC